MIEFLEWDNMMPIFIILFVICIIIDNWTREDIGWYDEDKEEECR